MSDVGEVTVIGWAIALYRAHTCHVHRCWRWQRHHVEGTPYITCRKHHPAVPDSVTAEHVAKAHKKETPGAR